ncbi:uncharacterized protein LOC117172953 [Belonocnema kinseyi]|uniref:uncharacterized protein LOC117172953 n=1 Tax=Belonocnema kinseyi TaxID=2817044 RepID=UPI00143D4BFA|nr:uncharacterized protein LOC117172953 [Belonocnema kinseyi]XP_033217165.1 uncharacterized protein LOC117172953 [Belonocnema kinseyi]
MRKKVDETIRFRVIRRFFFSSLKKKPKRHSESDCENSDSRGLANRKLQERNRDSGYDKNNMSLDSDHSSSSLDSSSKNSISSKDHSIVTELKRNTSNRSKTTTTNKMTQTDDTNDTNEQAIKNAVVSRIIKAFGMKLESVKRRILYDLNNKINEVKAMIVAANDVDQTLPEREILPQLPMTNKENFLSLEQQLTESAEMTTALKSFIRHNTKLLKDFKAAINAVLPMIISKEVQLQYSGFGRFTKGQRKENFSKTTTCTILKEIVLQKFADISVKDFNSYITRWLSNASDRDGGKKLRLSAPVVLQEDPQENVKVAYL